MYSATSPSSPWHSSGPNGNGCGARGTSASKAASEGILAAGPAGAGLTPTNAGAATSRRGRRERGCGMGSRRALGAIRRLGRRPLALRGRGDGVEVDLRPRLGREERLEPLHRRHQAAAARGITTSIAV